MNTVRQSAESVVSLLERCCKTNPVGTVSLLHDLAATALLDVHMPSSGVWIFTAPGGQVVAEVQIAT